MYLCLSFTKSLQVNFLKIKCVEMTNGRYAYGILLANSGISFYCELNSLCQKISCSSIGCILEYWYIKNTKIHPKNLQTSSIISCSIKTHHCFQFHRLPSCTVLTHCSLEASLHCFFLATPTLLLSSIKI